MTAIPLIALLYLFGSFVVGTVWTVAWLLGHGKRRRKKHSIALAHLRLDERIAEARRTATHKP